MFVESAGDPAAVAAVRAALDERGAGVPIRRFDAAVPSAAAAAEQIGCDPGAVVWAGAGDEHSMFPTSAAQLLDLTGGTLVDVAVQDAARDRSGSCGSWNDASCGCTPHDIGG